MMDHEQIFHFAKAALLAVVATLLLVFHQIRHSFHETREAFVAFQRQKNRETRPQKRGKKGKKSANGDSANEDDGTYIVAFFHPRCSAGGGGERVLWKSIEALGEMKEGKLMKRRSKTKKENTSSGLAAVGGNVGHDAIRMNCRNVSVVVYTVDEPSANYDKEVMEKVRDRFSIIIPSSLSVHFVHLHEVKDLLSEYFQYAAFHVIVLCHNYW